jgi:hypothetical protein
MKSSKPMLEPFAKVQIGEVVRLCMQLPLFRLQSRITTDPK